MRKAGGFEDVLPATKTEVSDEMIVAADEIQVG